MCGRFFPSILITALVVVLTPQQLTEVKMDSCCVMTAIRVQLNRSISRNTPSAAFTSDDTTLLNVHFIVMLQTRNYK